jgi:PTS system nitrogen regulatory IIA component
MIKIFSYLDSELISFLDCQTRDEALNKMVENLLEKGKITNKEAFLQALLDREKIVSTGIGMGVAIPHAKFPEYDDFFITIGLLKNGVHWGALDGAPVRIIFMIGGPDDKQTEYLQILSALTMAIKDEERRKKMLTLNSPISIIELFDKF